MSDHPSLIPKQDDLEPLKKELKEAQIKGARLQQIIDTALDAIILIDTKGTIQSCNQAATMLFGYEKHEMLGRNVNMLMPDEISVHHDQFLRNYIRTGTKKIIGIGREIQGQHKNGVRVDLFLSVSEIKIDGILYFSGILRDISRIKIAQQKLINSEARTNAIINNAVDSIIVINAEGTMQSINQAVQRIFGYHSDELIGQNISLLMSEPMRSEHDNYLKRYIATGERRIIGIGREIKALKKDGTEFDAHLSVSEAFIDGEHLFTGMVRDISAEKEQAKKIEATNMILNEQNEQKDQLNQLHESLKGEQSLKEITDNFFELVSQQLPLLVGACYHMEKGGKIYLINHFALSEEQKILKNEHHCLITQVIQQRRIYICDNLHNMPLWTETTFTKLVPQQLLILPLELQGRLIGAIELGMKEPLSKIRQDFLRQAALILATGLESAYTRQNLNALLKKLKTNEEALRQTNEALEQKIELVDQQQHEILKRNNEIEEKARRLSESNQYKSAFLANMSHELRTPLNSLLLLTDGLKKNRLNNLFEEQIEDLEVIAKSGRTLLALINDILDLSKVEAGKMELTMLPFSIEELIANLIEQFMPIANEKSITFTVDNQVTQTTAFNTDQLRLEQILRNLLSNAFKFTEQDKIIFHLTEDLEQKRLAFIVEDSGLGIPEDKQESIFQAFQQVDGSTTRQYGGTGLGLSICCQLAKLFGGEIELTRSEIGKGSIFTLYLPIESASEAPSENIVLSPTDDVHKKYVPFESSDSIDDFSNQTVLMIEDDDSFIQIVSKIATQRGLTFLTAKTGKEGLKLAKSKRPHAIILDLGLPDISGEMIHQRLQNDSNTKEIPIHIITAKSNGFSWNKPGIIEFLTKPVKESSLNQLFKSIKNRTKAPIKRLLIIEDDQVAQYAMGHSIHQDQLSIISAFSGKQAIEILKKEKFDCIILDYKLPDMNALELLRLLDSELKIAIPPTILYTGQDLDKDQLQKLNHYVQVSISKGEESLDRLLREINLFLYHLNIKKNTFESEKILKKSHTVNLSTLPPQSIRSTQSKHFHKTGLKITEKPALLLVDNDLKNSFALSKQLECENFDVIVADGGELAIEKLEASEKMDMILMDILMPEIDGYKAIEMIRKLPRWKNTPIIALTAKAMLEDTQKCLDVGASDYLTKPIDFETLLHKMRCFTPLD